jgi:hypothetical protein
MLVLGNPSREYELREDPWTGRLQVGMRRPPNRGWVAIASFLPGVTVEQAHEAMEKIILPPFGTPFWFRKAKKRIKDDLVRMGLSGAGSYGGNPTVTDFGPSPSESWYSPVGQIEGTPERGGKFKASVFERRPDGLFERAYHGEASLMLYKDNPVSGPVDEGAARELELYIENDADLYRQQFIPIVQNLMRKRAKGKFDFEKSVKLWMHLVDSGARKYIAEFGVPGQKIDSVFNRNTRLAVARSLAQTFVTEADLGNYDGRGGNPLRGRELSTLNRMGLLASQDAARAKPGSVDEARARGRATGYQDVSKVFARPKQWYSMTPKEFFDSRRAGNPLTLGEHQELLRMHSAAGDESVAFRKRRNWGAAQYKAGEASGLFKAAVEFDSRNVSRYGFPGERGGNPGPLYPAAGAMLAMAAGNPSRRAPGEEDVEVEMWFERDRAHVEIRDKKTGKTLAEWWDDDVRQMFEDGFFRGWGGYSGSPELARSVIEYAKSVGILRGGNPLTKSEVKRLTQWKDAARASERFDQIHNRPIPAAFEAGRANMAHQVIGHFRADHPVPPVWGSNPVSRKAGEFIAKKIRKLIREGYPPDQASAIAYDMARRKGYRSVPRRKGKRGRNPAMGNLPPHIANDPAFQAELRAYRRRHGAGPVEVRKIRVPKGFPKYLSTYGEADHAVYDAPPHSKKGKRIHHFGKRGRGRPHLASSVARGPKFLAYVAGNFRAKTDWLYD